MSKAYRKVAIKINYFVESKKLLLPHEELRCIKQKVYVYLSWYVSITRRIWKVDEPRADRVEREWPFTPSQAPIYQGSWEAAAVTRGLKVGRI